jgi:protein O-mannosyl-transferase
MKAHLDNRPSRRQRRRKRLPSTVSLDSQSGSPADVALRDPQWRVMGQAAVLILIILAAYIPALAGGFIWDDDSYVTGNVTLQNIDGLRRIWAEPGAVPQYYPLAFTTFWIEYHLWNLTPLGYHIVNVLVHATNAVLLWCVLYRLNVPGAWVAAAIFGLHPVHVESVAWVAECKTLLSTAFYLSGILAYLRFSELNTTAARGRARWQFYGLAFASFAAALLSKTVACSLPAAILLLLWWKRDRITWSDLLPVIPLFVLGVALACMTVWVEKHVVGARGKDWSLSLADRCLVAGRALWFYASKLVWPRKLTFMYPRWAIDSGVWWQYLFPLGAVAVLATLWLGRQRFGKPPLIGVLFFAGTLVPALGFVDVYPMRFSFVADHYQYLASVGLIALGTALACEVLRRSGIRTTLVAPTLSIAILVVLGQLVWKQAHIYRDTETLWRDTIAKNSDSWIAHNNLGFVLYRQGRLEEAVAHYHEALRIKPDHPLARPNLAVALTKLGRLDEAVAQYREALRLYPNDASSRVNLGALLEGQGRLDEAISQYREALRISPQHTAAQRTLARALQRLR